MHWERFISSNGQSIPVESVRFIMLMLKVRFNLLVSSLTLRNVIFSRSEVISADCTSVYGDSFYFIGFISPKAFNVCGSLAVF